MSGKGAAVKFAAIRHAASISWEPCRISEERFKIEIISCCNMYIWASENDVYAVMQHTEDGAEIAVMGTWDEARPVWDVLTLAHDQRHAILMEYSAPKKPPAAASAWVPCEPSDTVKIRETSCCGIYEWASQGGIFFVLQRTANGFLETARGPYRHARQEWQRLLGEHQKAHLSMAGNAKARRRGKVEHPTNEALE